MDDNEITQRLRDAGRQPVPGEVRSSHLSQMHAATPTVEKQKRFGRLAVAAAAFVGFAVGSTGFAMAGALPDPAQGVAHDVLSVVQVNVPDRPDNHGRCVSAAAQQHRDDETAKQDAKDLCKETHPPGRSDNPGQGKGRANGGGPPDHVMNDGDDCKGPPPWAGKGAKDATPEEKQAFKDERVNCGPDVEENEVEEPEELEAEETDEAEPQGPPDGIEPVPPAEQPPVEQAPAEQPPAEQGTDTPGETPAEGEDGQPGAQDAPVDVPAPLEQDAGEG